MIFYKILYSLCEFIKKRIPIKFKEIFMTKYNEGYGVGEIAEMCHITSRYGYMLLQEIADANGVSRDELLKIKNRKQPEGNFGGKQSAKVIDADTLKGEFQEVIGKVDGIISKIDGMLKL